MDEKSLMEVTVNVSNPFVTKMAKLLQQKDKLVGKDTGDGRNQYQIEVQKLKDQMKAYKKGGGEGYVSFGKLLKNVKKQEREGKFDRGAEGKTKKNLFYPSSFCEVSFLSYLQRLYQILLGVLPPWSF